MTAVRVDQALLKQAARGDGDAFTCLYETYLEPVSRHIHYRVGGREEVEDLTQDETAMTTRTRWTNQMAMATRTRSANQTAMRTRTSSTSQTARQTKRTTILTKQTKSATTR